MSWLEDRAAEMRRRPTGIEVFVHNLLDREGVKFEFQKPLIGRFIVDFFISPNIVIEVDGPHHEKQRDRDGERDARLRSAGFAVLRITYKQLNFGTQYLSDYELTWEQIKTFLRSAGARDGNWDPSYDRDLSSLEFTNDYLKQVDATEKELKRIGLGDVVIDLAEDERHLVVKALEYIMNSLRANSEPRKRIEVLLETLW
jgi:very-short-patch-repair endonuclease